MKNLKVGLIVAGAVLLGAASIVAFLSGGAEERSDERPKAVSAKIRAAKAQKEKSLQRLRARRAKSEKVDAAASVRRERPKFELPSAEEEKLTALQQKLLEEIRAALRADDYKTLMKLVRKMQSSDEWPDGIPNAIKKAALEALGWYGSKCLPEIIPFLADADPQIVADAISQWEDAIAECDSDREVSEQVKLASRVVVDNESVESILVESMNMRNSVAIETFKDVLANGNAAAKAKVLEQIADFTDDATITTAEQLDAWLKNHPDDPGDEEMYGGIDDAAADDD